MGAHDTKVVWITAAELARLGARHDCETPCLCAGMRQSNGVPNRSMSDMCTAKGRCGMAARKAAFIRFGVLCTTPHTRAPGRYGCSE